MIDPTASDGETVVEVDRGALSFVSVVSDAGPELRWGGATSAPLERDDFRFVHIRHERSRLSILVG